MTISPARYQQNSQLRHTSADHPARDATGDIDSMDFLAGQSSGRVRQIEPAAPPPSQSEGPVGGERTKNRHRRGALIQAKRVRLRFAYYSAEIASHLRHALIAVLAKEGRRLVILKNALTLLVLVALSKRMVHGRRDCPARARCQTGRSLLY
jgi:hypothetical protein